MHTSIIFSKDRPFQLDGCLRSIKKNFNLGVEHKIHVIYNSSNYDIELDYHNIIKEHPDVGFWFDQDRCIFVAHLITMGAEPYVTLFTDDDLFYAPVDSAYEDIDNLMSSKDIFCLSFRLGANIYKRDYGDGVLREDVGRPYLSYRKSKRFLYWPLILSDGYWGYPLSLDGHLYRKEDLSSRLEKIVAGLYNTKQTPNVLESRLYENLGPNEPSIMACEITSKVVNSPNNRVQSEYENRCGDHYNYSPKLLLEKYRKGHRMNLDIFNNLRVECPHQEIDILKGC